MLYKLSDFIFADKKLLMSKKIRLSLIFAFATVKPVQRFHRWQEKWGAKSFHNRMNNRRRWMISAYYQGSFTRILLVHRSIALNCGINGGENHAPTLIFILPAINVTLIRILTRVFYLFYKNQFSKISMPCSIQIPLGTFLQIYCFVHPPANLLCLMFHLGCNI